MPDAVPPENWVMLQRGWTPLPIDSALPALTAALEAGPAAVLQAPPGSGKTTRVPLVLLRAPWRGADERIVMLQPRRAAARAAAARLAAELGEPLGQTVGYAIRFERKVSRATRIEVVTEGLLLRRLLADPSLVGTRLVIFDEVHERSLDSDLALALARETQQALRPDLKLLAMSATLDGARLADFLGDEGLPAPLVTAEGRIHPVATRYAARPALPDLARAVAQACLEALRAGEGSVLAFLPGAGEIRRAEAYLAERAPADVDVWPLYAALPAEAQARALGAPAPGRRHVVLATTLAETSLTVPNIGAVVDGGYRRRPRFDLAMGTQTLVTERISRAAAEQRRGRAGRLGPGLCLRLWPEPEDRGLSPFDAPEILETDLSGLVLALAEWGARADTVAWLDPPPPRALHAAESVLERVGALEPSAGGGFALTQRGQIMARLPLPPRPGAILAAALAAQDQRRIRLAAQLAARLSEPAERGETDLVTHLGRAVGDPAQRRLVDQLLQQMEVPSGPAAPPSQAPLLALPGYPDRIALPQGAPGRFALSGGGAVTLPETDPLSRAEALLVLDYDGTADGVVRLALALPRAQLEAAVADRIQTQQRVVWDARQGAVRAVTEWRLGALLLGERPLDPPPAGQVVAAVIDGIRLSGLDVLPWSEGQMALRARLGFAARHQPGADWPALDDATLLATLPDWLGPYLDGIRRAEHLRRLDLEAPLAGLVPYEVRRRLERALPLEVGLPSGRTVTVDYAAEGGPIIAAKLQEFFGAAALPTVLEGAVPLRAELLSPAGRPLALVTDLGRFWREVYPQVRAEIRGRYPKHPWPDDPLAHRATALTKNALARRAEG